MNEELKDFLLVIQTANDTSTGVTISDYRLVEIGRSIQSLEQEKNNAYHERNLLVAALSKLFPSSLETHVGMDWEEEWRWVVIMDLPAGQVSWHIHISELSLFDHLDRNIGRVWDGHTTEEKYKRLECLPF